MDNEKSYLKSNLEKKQIKKKEKKNYFLFLINFICYLIIIPLLFHILHLKVLLNKYKESHKKNKDLEYKYKEIIKKYNEQIQFYKEMLQLYIDNKTQFFIKGREKIMESNGNLYNDSNINTIQDKLNWLLIHDNPIQKANIVDKILLHNYSKKIIGKDICVPILKIYNSVEEIDFNELPDKFVLKCNHGSGMNILCNNKSNLNIIDAKSKLNKWIKINFGLFGYEYQYLKVKRKIFAEKFLSNNINDYKIYCFNGEPKFIRVQKLLDNDTKINNYYNLDWSINEIETGLGNHFIRRPDILFEKPKNLELMLKYAKIFSHNFSFVRVDLYDINDTIYLGELTFSPSNCKFKCKDLNQSIYLGKLLNINS